MKKSIACIVAVVLCFMAWSTFAVAKPVAHANATYNAKFQQAMDEATR
jgi:hypothetical protein